MIRKFLVPLFFSLSVCAQKPSSVILHQIEKLNVTGSVLYIAAHPDDENTRLLAWLANEKKVRTAYLSLTRGDGGQNLIGKEQGEALGLIRTQELLAARRTDGAEQFFTRANDFGFSKNPEETFTFWNKDSILYDVVLAIRKFKPDVIICRFPTTGEGGHGHHTASAILALEAFDAAADPARFPEQLKISEVWKCKRIFWNTFNFGGTNTTSENQLKVNCGNFNPLLGKSYGEIAAESRSMHKSQGFGSARQRGTSMEYFKLLKGDSAKTDLLDGVNTSWSRMPGAGDISKAIESCLAAFNAERPEKSIPALVKIYNQVNSLDEQNADIKHWKKIKLKALKELIADCSGIFAEIILPQYSASPGETVSYSMQIISRNDVPVKLKQITFLSGNDSLCNKELKRDELTVLKSSFKIPEGENYSDPYWLSRPHGAGHYWYPGDEKAGTPENAPAASGKFQVEIEGLTFEIQKPAEYKSTDPVKGELYRRLEILPAVNIQPASKLMVFTGSEKQTFNVILKANQSKQKGFLRIVVPAGWKIQRTDSIYDLSKKGDELNMSFTIQPVPDAISGKVSFYAMSVDGQNYHQRINRIDYDHIPPQFFLEPAQAKLVKMSLKKGRTNIGYIPGAGDEVADCLQLAGYHVTILNDELLKQNQLSKYDAIVTGVRAFNTNDKLYTYSANLLKYVSEGGNLLVQYNTNSRVGPLQSGFGPYPFTISRDRVTDENAKVTFSNKAHVVLNQPNKIDSTDFSGWVQERGIYFATEIDKHYETVFEMNDKNEKPHNGSLIIAPHGKGNFVYTGLAFFRELPAGVGGAYRLFSNLLALPKNQK